VRAKLKERPKQVPETPNAAFITTINTGVEYI
jgi:hypothetical protein